MNILWALLSSLLKGARTPTQAWVPVLSVKIIKSYLSADDEYPWERTSDNELDAKYLYVCHAELNALLNYTGTNLKNATIYTTLFPCNECTKALIQSGIKEVIYMSDKYSDTPSVIAAKRMMNSAGVKFTPYKPINRNIELQL